MPGLKVIHKPCAAVRVSLNHSTIQCESFGRFDGGLDRLLAMRHPHLSASISARLLFYSKKTCETSGCHRAPR
jgi:hypothetical protein